MASRVNQGLGESIGARCLEIVSGRLSSAESEPTYQELCLFLHGRERQAVTLLRAGRIGWASSEQKAGDQGLAQWIEHTLLLREHPSLAACTHVWWVTPTFYSSFMGPKPLASAGSSFAHTHIHMHN